MTTTSEPAEVDPCPHCGTITGVREVPGTGTPPGVQAWSCVECGTEWAVTVVNPHLRQRYLDELAAEVAVRAVLRDITTLAGRLDTLAVGQVRAQLIGCLGRLDAVCRHSAVYGFPVGCRSSDGVPGTQPVPRSAAPDATGTRTTP